MASDSEMLVPMWLDTEFLEGILRKYHNNDGIKITDFYVGDTDFNGESFMSTMYRAEVEFKFSTEDEEISTVDVILKLDLSEMRNALTNFDVFEKEAQFYEKLAPKINEKLTALNEPQLLPVFYGICREKRVMVIEDLCAKGYKKLHGPNKCNIVETRAILKRMAVFNAIGAVMQKEEADIFVNFKSGHLTRDVDVFVDMFVGLYDALLYTLSQWPEFKTIHDRMIRLRKDLPDKWRRALDVRPRNFNALVHNDLWPPNIMVTGKVEGSSVDEPFGNITFIDFQNTMWNSPAADLHLFLNMSVCEPFFPDAFDELVEFYHSHLVSVLERLKYDDDDIPEFYDFYRQYNNRKILGFIASCLEQAVTIDNDGDVTYKRLLVNDEEGIKLKRQLYQKPNVQTLIRKMIPYYNDIGLFDLC